jgi:hypothetical protein
MNGYHNNWRKIQVEYIKDTQLGIEQLNLRINLMKFLFYYFFGR